MTRLTGLGNPLLIGFDRLEQALERVARGVADGYPPYNVEDRSDDGLGLTLAVAGFAPEDLDVTVEGDRLVVRGRRRDDDGAARLMLHQGIAARAFQRTFLLADGIDVVGARLDNGLLTIDLARPAAAETIRRIPIQAGSTVSEPVRRKVRQA